MPRVLTLDDLDDAAQLLAQGLVVAIPTDTVYGLAAALADGATVARLSVLKHRPSSMPIAVLCATPDAAIGVATSWSTGAARLAARYWPGPLTIIVPVAPELAAILGSAGTAGLRVPDDDVCRALLARTGPLAVTSANLHGAPPATSPTDVLTAFGATLDAVIDDGRRDGAVSTVVDVSGHEPVIVREGALSGADVREVLSEA